MSKQDNNSKKSYKKVLIAITLCIIIVIILFARGCSTSTDSSSPIKLRIKEFIEIIRNDFLPKPESLGIIDTLVDSTPGNGELTNTSTQNSGDSEVADNTNNVGYVTPSPSKKENNGSSSSSDAYDSTDYLGTTTSPSNNNDGNINQVPSIVPTATPTATATPSSTVSLNPIIIPSIVIPTIKPDTSVVIEPVVKPTVTPTKEPVVNNPTVDGNEYFEVPGYQDAIIEQGGTFILGNPPQNDVYLKYNVYHGDDLIYTTTLIEPGKKTDCDKLSTMVGNEQYTINIVAYNDEETKLSYEFNFPITVTVR